ncbi:ATP-binding protein [Vannielia litorea]|uniref:sensor histidine kinase n=1 Tax=Vannielia litorea TaxID=1217970 RepID=UPI000940CD36
MRVTAFNGALERISELRRYRQILADLDLRHPVSCDPDRIGQVVSNLLSNAITHGTPGSPVRISAGSQSDFTFVEVENEGQAIDREAQQVLFSPFRRANDRSKGLGLGLHIASSIAKVHGGPVDRCQRGADDQFQARGAQGWRSTEHCERPSMI